MSILQLMKWYVPGVCHDPNIGTYRPTLSSMILLSKTSHCRIGFIWIKKKMLFILLCPWFIILNLENEPREYCKLHVTWSLKSIFSNLLVDVQNERVLIWWHLLKLIFMCYEFIYLNISTKKAHFSWKVVKNTCVLKTCMYLEISAAPVIDSILVYCGRHCNQVVRLQNYWNFTSEPKI